MTRFAFVACLLSLSPLFGCDTADLARESVELSTCSEELVPEDGVLLLLEEVGAPVPSAFDLETGESDTISEVPSQGFAYEFDVHGGDIVLAYTAPPDDGDRAHSELSPHGACRRLHVEGPHKGVLRRHEGGSLTRLPRPSPWAASRPRARSPAPPMKSPSPHPALLLFAVIFSGMAQAMISAPASTVWLHPVSWIPAFWVFSQVEGRRALLYGWFCGIAGPAAIFFWLVDTITRFSNLPFFVAVLILLLFSALFGFYVGIFAWGFSVVRRLSGTLWPLAIAAWFCACEYLNPQLFPYFQGVAWYQHPSIFLITAITGVAGVSMLVMLANGVGLALLERWLAAREGDELPPIGDLRTSAVVLAVLLLLGLGYCQLRLAAIDRAEEEAPSVRLAAIQSDQDVYQRRELMRKGKTAIADNQLRLLRKTLDEDPGIDAFVLPEGALQGRPDWPRNVGIRDFVEDTGVEIWTGGSSSRKVEDGRRLWFNSAFRLHGAGETDARYDKNVLLPFGEYMPGASLFPFLRKIKGVGNYQPGEGVIVYEALGHARFTFLICYEAILSRYVRRAVNEGANLLVNVSYDAWYGDTACPHQFLMLVVLQSAQNGVPTARAATTGISAFADARGRFIARGPLFERIGLVQDVKLVRLPSLYTLLGDWFAWLCVFAMLWLFASRRTSGLLQARISEVGERVEEPAKWRSLWPLGIFLVGAAVNALIVFGGIGPMG